MTSKAERTNHVEKGQVWDLGLEDPHRILEHHGEMVRDEDTSKTKDTKTTKPAREMFLNQG